MTRSFRCARSQTTELMAAQLHGSVLGARRGPTAISRPVEREASPQNCGLCFPRPPAQQLAPGGVCSELAAQSTQ
eukprot:5228854-Pyramimonas_sp.AAC.1